MRKLLWGALFLFAIGGTLFITLRISPEDLETYTLLQEESQAEEESLLSFAHQLRTNVGKEVWRHGERGPMHLTLNADESQLFLFPQKGKVEVIEKLDGVRCLFQEELFYLLPGGKKSNIHEVGAIPMQRVRLALAKEGNYNYATHTFMGANVELASYELEGHTLPTSLEEEKPLFTGHAEYVEIHMDVDHHHLTAHGLQAHFGETCAGF